MRQSKQMKRILREQWAPFLQATLERGRCASVRLLGCGVDKRPLLLVRACLNHLQVLPRDVPGEVGRAAALLHPASMVFGQ